MAAVSALDSHGDAILDAENTGMVIGNFQKDTGEKKGKRKRIERTKEEEKTKDKKD